MTDLSSDGMEVILGRGPDGVFVEVWGGLDVNSAPRLADTLALLIDDAGERNIVVDLNEVTFLDADGVDALASSVGHMRERSGQVLLRGRSPAIRQLLELS